MAKRTTRAEFESIFPKLTEVILEHAGAYKAPRQALDWFKQVDEPRAAIR